MRNSGWVSIVLIADVNFKVLGGWVGTLSDRINCQLSDVKRTPPKVNNSGSEFYACKL